MKQMSLKYLNYNDLTKYLDCTNYGVNYYFHNNNER